MHSLFIKYEANLGEDKKSYISMKAISNAMGICYKTVLAKYKQFKETQLFERPARRRAYGAENNQLSRIHRKNKEVVNLIK